MGGRESQEAQEALPKWAGFTGETHIFVIIVVFPRETAKGYQLHSSKCMCTCWKDPGRPAHFEKKYQTNSGVFLLASQKKTLPKEVPNLQQHPCVQCMPGVFRSQRSQNADTFVALGSINKTTGSQTRSKGPSKKTRRILGASQDFLARLEFQNVFILVNADSIGKARGRWWVFSSLRG